MCGPSLPGAVLNRTEVHCPTKDENMGLFRDMWVGDTWAECNCCSWDYPWGLSWLGCVPWSAHIYQHHSEVRRWFPLEEFAEKSETQYKKLLYEVLRKCWETEWHHQKPFTLEGTLWPAGSWAYLCTKWSSFCWTCLSLRDQHPSPAWLFPRQSI